MKRTASLLFFLLCIAVWASSSKAQADTGIIPATISGGNANKVHLRAEPSTRAASLGLYFTGTDLLCESDPTEEWTRVVIGAQKGYIKSEYLRWGEAKESVQSKQPISIAKTKNWINVRNAPSKEARVDNRLYDGDAVILLGETNERWSYIKIGDAYGYVMSKFLRVIEKVELYYDQYLENYNFEESGRAFYGIGIIDAGVAAGAHLREWNDDSSQSYGEYYNGTKAICVTDPKEAWVCVWVGNLIGNIRSENLCFDASKAPNAQFEYGKIIEDSILSSEPFDDTLTTFAGDEQVKKGQIVTILGIIDNSYYLADSGKGWGYIRCESVQKIKSNH